MTSRCGPFLERCVCRRTPTVARDAAEMQARHEAAVARAHRSGWAAASPQSAVLPPLSAAQRREALSGIPGHPGSAQPVSAPVPSDPAGRGWQTIADAVRAIERRGAA